MDNAATFQDKSVRESGSVVTSILYWRTSVPKVNPEKPWLGNSQTRKKRYFGRAKASQRDEALALYSDSGKQYKSYIGKAKKYTTVTILEPTRNVLALPKKMPGHEHEQPGKCRLSNISTLFFVFSSACTLD